jgi:cysteinyl-tRNA synthetase
LPAKHPDFRNRDTVTLRIYDTLRRAKVDFEPLNPGHVRFYVCGPTVYDFAHIGNARPVVVFDVLARLMRRLYPRVTYVRNITDVEDKINTRAQELGEDIRDLTERTAMQFHEDMAALGNLPPDVEPRATDHIAEMIVMISELINRKHAYEADGHVLFSVPSMPDYGKLSCRRCRTTENSRVTAVTSWWPAPVSTSRPTRRTRPISCCGSPRRQTCPAGTARGAAVGRAGISNARP